MNTSFQEYCSEETPRIYVACLSSYNAGKLHGRWIECDQAVDDIRTQIKEMLSLSTEPLAEEWAIHDYEHFDGIALSEHECLDDITAFCESRDEWGELLSLVVNQCGGLGQLEEALKKLKNNYSGEADSLESWVENFLAESGKLEKIPESLRYYIDFEQYARDLEVNGDISTIESDGKVHIFLDH